LKPGPTDRPLLYLLVFVNLALLVALPIGVYSLWQLLGTGIYRDGPGRLKPLLLILATLGEFLLLLRLRGAWRRLRGI